MDYYGLLIDNLLDRACQELGCGRFGETGLMCSKIGVAVWPWIGSVKIGVRYGTRRSTRVRTTG